MPYITRTNKEKMDLILDDRIKNLHPKLRETLYNQYIDDPILNVFDNCRKKITNDLELTNLNRSRIQYWKNRGWSELESKIKSREFGKTLPKRISPYSREFWTRKINPETNRNYTIQEADYERNSRRPIRKEYWIEKGYDEQEAEVKAKETKSRNNINGGEGSRSRSFEEIKASSMKNVEYWTIRGYSVSDAIQIISESQKTFSKEICIDRYGEEDGLKKWQERQDKWQNTLNSKPDEEIAEINKKKLSSRNSISKAEYEIYEQIKHIPSVEHQGNIANINYIYDFIDHDKKKIIEYNGDYWHANPEKYDWSFINKSSGRTMKEIHDKDKLKLDTAKHNGYEVKVIWESEYKNNKKQVIKECVTFLTQYIENSQI